MSDIVTNIQFSILSVPFGIRLIGLVMLFTSIHDAFLTPLYVEKLGEISYKVAQGEVWRLFTATFVSGGLLDFLLAFILFYNVSSQIEQVLGTLVFLLDFLAKGFMINLLTFLFNFVLWYVQPTFMSTMNYGLWPLIVYYLASKCIASPYTKVKIYWEFQNYMIGAVMIGLIILISTSLSIVVALQIAFIEQLLFNGVIIRLAPVFFKIIQNTIQRLEQFRLYSQFTNYACYKKPIQNLLEERPNRPLQIGTEEQFPQAQIIQ